MANLHEFRMICANSHVEDVSECIFPELHKRTGQTVRVLNPYMQMDVDGPETLWRIRFADGLEHDAFDCELV